MSIENIDVAGSFPTQMLLSFLIGVGLVAIFMIALGIGKIWRHTWAWIDDARPLSNPVHTLLARLLGWSKREPKYDWDDGHWEDKKGRRQTDPAIIFVIPLFLGPVFLLIGFKLYPVVLAAITFFFIAHVARFARRTKKVFEKHVIDPKAHE